MGPCPAQGEIAMDVPGRHTRVSRISRPAVLLLQGVVLLLFFGCTPPESERTRVPVAGGSSTAKRVDAIQVEARRIDAAVEVPEAAGLRRVRKDLQHWQFSGLLENSTPIFLNAIFTQGQVVREETYYLLHGKLLLVKAEKWWDVDDASHAPEPKSRQDFYIENDWTIRQIIEVSSSPPVSRTSDTTRPAAALVERTRLITQILLGGAERSAVAPSLEVFPDAEASKP